MNIHKHNHNHNHKKIIFIIGMHRCGTSLLSNCIVKNGFSIGKTQNKDKNWQNPNGYFENDSFHTFHEKLLQLNKSNWHTINKDKMTYTDEHVHEYRQLITDEFENNTHLLIKDPRLTFFTEFLKEVCNDLDYYFIFCTRNKEECCNSLCKAQNISKEKAYNLYDTTHAYYDNSFLKINHSDLIYKNNKIINELLTFIGFKKNIILTSDLVNLELYRHKFYPIEIYPNRVPLDISEVIKNIL
jgi:hypothetical protein